MMRTLWRNAWRKMALLAVAGVISGAAANEIYGQDFSPQAMMERLDRLERQNRELQQKLQNLSSPTATEAVGGGGVDPKTVETIVSDYLKKQETARKKADETKKSADDAKKLEPVAVGSDQSLKAFWKDGLNFESPNKDFKVHVGGRGQFDIGAFEQTPNENLPAYRDAAGFRRARLRIDGTCWEVFDWVTEYDFANPDGIAATATFTDVFIAINQLPYVGTFKAGHFKEEFSLEELTSDNDITFFERSIAHSALVPSRHLGLQFQNTIGEQERARWAIGAFRTNGAGNRNFDQGDGEYSITGRVTWLPVYTHDGRCLVHVGAAASHRAFNNSDDPDPLFFSRTSIRLGTPILLSASGGPLSTSDHVNLYGGEVATVLGPFSVQSEIFAAQANNAIEDEPSPLYWGAYVQASYFLTGENRAYSKKLGAFDRVRPLEPFYLVRGGTDEEGRRTLFGRGAWELTARYAYLDLSSDGLVVPTSAERAGGTGFLQDMTLGVNWYWTSNFKWQFNYVRAWRHSETVDRSGIVDAFAVRFAWNF